MAEEDTVRARIQDAGKFFQVIFYNDVLIGFVNGTCVREPTIHEDSMSTHCPDGRYLVIHSVTVSPRYRRKLIGTDMLKDYIKLIATYKEIDGLLLISKAYLLSFYVQTSFALVGLWPYAHGQVCAIVCVCGQGLGLGLELGLGLGLGLGL